MTVSDPENFHNPLPRPSRFITTHNEGGEAIYSDALIEGVPFWAVGKKSDPAGFGLAYTTSESPVPLNQDRDLSHFVEAHERRQAGSLVNPGGSVLRYVDYPPNGVSPMHRTVSCDYAILLIGEMECLLDSGERRIMKEGDVLIQRGTMHQWINRRDSWARMLYVLLDASQVEVAAGRLGEDLGEMEGVPRTK